jgi:hypothetical protein
MVNLLVVLVALIAIFVVSKFIHFRHIRHRISAIVLILLVLFLYTSIAGVVSKNDIDLKTPKGIFEAGKVYLSWLGQTFTNLKELTGNAIKMEWMPKNISITSSIG